MLAVTKIDVKCVLYEINKNNRANATHRLESGQKMFGNRTEAMLDRRDPGPPPGHVLTRVVNFEISLNFLRKI